MYKLILLYTHGFTEISGTRIFVLEKFNTSKNSDSLVGMFLYDERDVLINSMA